MDSSEHGRDRFFSRKNTVFLISGAISLIIALWGIIASGSFSVAANAAMAWLEKNFEWLYLYGMLFFVLFCLVLAFSKLGRVKLGGDDEKPQHSTVSWFAMLFAAGMGIGLVFWGMAEPLSHYVAPMAGIQAFSEESYRFSIRSVFMHWGLHPWACYAVVGLCLGYFMFRKKKPALESETLEPIIGKKKDGALGKAIDIYTVILTAIGVATSFGMGCLQISGGLNYLFGVNNGVVTWLIITVIVCSIFLWSSMSGIDRGIKLLSNTNLVLCALFMIGVFAVGPHIDIVRRMLVGIGDYLVNFFPDSVRMSANGDASWILAWRVFYWAWWLSWAPFVGIFIARISRGRSIRQFVLGTMIAPTIVSIIWFAINGVTAIDTVISNFTQEQIAEITASPTTAIFVVLGQHPLGTALSVLAMLLLFIFFITSADSATFVLSMLTSEGDFNPPKRKKLFWGILIGMMSFALILSGGVSAVQTVAVVISFPFFIIMLFMCFALVKALRKDLREQAQGIRTASATEEDLSDDIDTGDSKE